MGYQIPKRGNISLETGELVCKDSSNNIIGKLFVGPNGLTLKGEFTIWQDEDPGALRFASSYSTWRGALGKISFNNIRNDEGIQDEVMFHKGALSEDAVQGELFGQYEFRVLGRGDNEPKLQVIISDAYTLAEYGVSRMRTYIKELYLTGLWKFTQ